MDTESDRNLVSNVGLFDVLQALEWTKENIRKFGGDEGKITVGGHGSGAAIVSALTLNTRVTGTLHSSV